MCQQSPVARLFRWLCSWRGIRCLLIVVASFITLTVLAYTFENWRGKRAWEAHKRHWEAKGEKFTLAQLAPPPVPDDQNFAMTPLLKPLLDFSRSPDSVVWHDTNALARVEGIQVELEDSNKTRGLALGNLEKGTFADLAACQAYYHGHTGFPQPKAPGAAATDILVALGKFNPQIKELREAAAARPYSRFPVEYDCQPSWVMLLPHLAAVKQICQMTHVRALAHLELGQSPEAFEELKLGLRLSDSIRDEPIVISHLVRIATLRFNLQTLREGLVRHAWNDAQLAEIEKYLASQDLLAEYKLAMRAERTGEVGGLDWLRQQGFRVDPRNILWGPESEDAGFPKAVGRLMPGGWYYQNMLTMSEMFQELIFPAVDEKVHRIFPDKADTSDSQLEKMRTGPYNIFAKQLMPALSAAIKKSARWQTFVDAARVACALERYRLANGKIPETLDALTPRFIEGVPNDVINGEPLRYQLKPDGGYVIYSIGWNQTDDGGDIVLNPSGKGVDVTQGDWVWQMPAGPPR